MAWTVPTTRSTGYTVTAANWNELVGNFAHLDEVAYTSFSADVSITATTVGTANQIVSSGAITYENVPHFIYFYCPFVSPGTQVTHVIVRDSTTVLGRIAIVAASGGAVPMYTSFRVTPTAASHTYNIAAWNAAAATCTFNAGTGGAAGDGTTDLNGYIQVCRIPT